MSSQQFSKTPFSKAATSTRYFITDDSLDISASEQASPRSTADLTDGAFITITEQAVIEAAIITTDSLTLSITALAATFITLTTTQSINIIMSVEQSFVAVSTSSSDPPIITLDITSSVNTSIIDDSILTLALIEQSSVNIDSLLTDTLSVALAEIAIVDVVLSDNDNISVNVDEDLSNQIDNLLTDNCIITLEEISNININNLLVDNCIVNINDVMCELINTNNTIDSDNINLLENVDIKIDNLLTDIMYINISDDIKSLMIDHSFVGALNVLITDTVYDIIVTNNIIDNCLCNIIENINIVNNISSSDELNVKIDSIDSINANILLEDNLRINLIELLISQINNLLVDNCIITIDDNSIMNVDINDNDNINIILTEQSMVYKTDYLDLLDILNINITEIAVVDTVIQSDDNCIIELTKQSLLLNELYNDDSLIINKDENVILDFILLMQDIFKLDIDSNYVLNTDITNIDNMSILITEQSQVTIITSDNLNVSIIADTEIDIFNELYAKDNIFKIINIPYESNIALHHDAAQITGLNNNDRVITWHDISGNNVHATQNLLQGQQPRYIINGINNLPVVRFNRTSSQYLISKFQPNGGTLFIVCKLNTGFTNVVRGLLGVSGVPRYYMALNASNRISTGRGDNFGTSTTIFSNNVTYLFVMNYENNYNNIYNLLTNYNYYTSNFIGLNSNDIFIGNVNTIGSSYLHGDIGEIIIYNRDLNSAERIEITNYLDAKWQISQTQILEPIIPLNESSIIDVEHLNYDNFDITMLENIKDYNRNIYDNVLLSLAQVAYFSMFTGDNLSIDLNELSYVYYWHKLLYPLESDILQSKTGISIQDSETIVNILESKTAISIEDSKLILKILDSKTKIDIKRWY